MIFPLLLAVLAFATLLPILLPLLRGGRPVPGRSSYDQAVYRDQLQELDRDIARGLITGDEAETARLEIQRRILATDQAPSAAARLGRSPIVAVLVFVIIGFGSVGGYLYLGAPGVPDMPFDSRPKETAAHDDQQGLRDATARLEAKLAQNPDDAQGWLLYARSLAMLRQWDGAEQAFARAINLGQTDAEVLSDHAEMLVLQAGGTVTPAAEAGFAQALKADPSNAMARYYRALAQAQAGEPRKAIDIWQGLLAEMPADSPSRDPIAERIAEAAKAAGIPMPELAKGAPPEAAPDAAPAEPSNEPDAKAAAPAVGPDSQAGAAIASMPDEQRMAVIRSMVEKLAAKQQSDPGNLEGWMRLGQAYAVLHLPDKAQAAFDKAAALKPDDLSIRAQEVRALMTDFQPPAKIPAQVVGVLKQIEARDPQEPMVLWYLGIAAAQESRPAEARQYWQKLLAKMPPGGEDTKMIQSALDTLPK